MFEMILMNSYLERAIYSLAIIRSSVGLYMTMMTGELLELQQEGEELSALNNNSNLTIILKTLEEKCVKLKFSLTCFSNSQLHSDPSDLAKSKAWIVASQNIHS